MLFKRGFWFAVALAAMLLNMGGAIYAFMGAELGHAFLHGAAAFGFGLLAVGIRPRGGPKQPRVTGADRTQMLEANLTELERELQETRARLDFADQLLKNKPPTS